MSDGEGRLLVSDVAKDKHAVFELQAGRLVDHVAKSANQALSLDFILLSRESLELHLNRVVKDGVNESLLGLALEQSNEDLGGPLTQLSLLS